VSTVELRGVTMHLYEYEAVSEAIRQAGDFYEAGILDDLRARRPRERVIVDAGAHIGNHALYWSAFVPHEAILAFEPVPESFALLAANLAGDPTAICYQSALSDAPGMLRMSVDDVNRGRCAISDDGTLEVSAMTLDSLELDGVSLFKVDVESHQARVLAGASKTLERDRPAVLVEDEDGSGARVLAELGYRHVAEWPGANHLWEWA
jgi:FkbM family methyltransferase